MSTAFHFEDTNIQHAQNKARPSADNHTAIVSLAGEMFDITEGYGSSSAVSDQYMATSMADLFGGALGDDEIPSLLNLAMGMSPEEGNQEEAMQLLYGSSFPQEQSRTTSSPPMETVSTTNFVPISPAPPVVPEQATSQPGQKRGPLVNADNSNQHQQQSKKMKTVATPTLLPYIQPLPALNSMSSAGNGRSDKNSGVNTDTAHIRALTGTNGAAVCLEAIERALQDSGSILKPDGTCSSTSSNDGKHLNSEDKARYSRDRNRQHARNTRIRKKAYVEELKRTLNELVEERDTTLNQIRMEKQGIVEQKDVRLRVIEDFLQLRGRNEVDPKRWSLILEDGFSFRLPRADVPGVVCSSGGGDNSDNEVPSHPFMLGTSKKVLTGVNQVMDDAKRVAGLLQSLGALTVSYQCDRDSFMMDNASVVLNWAATSSGAITKGANAEFTINGTLRAGFNPISNKLVSMEFSF